MSGEAAEYLKKIEELQVEFLRLIQVKAEKLANIQLQQNRHTQLSYLTKEQQEIEVAFAKEAILTAFIPRLKQL